MTSKQKAKGNAFEREVAKYLTDTYSLSFHRIVNSGAYVGGSNAHRKASLDEHQGKAFRGDINAPDSWRYFNSEAKSYADLAFHQLMTECTQLERWLEQLMAVAEDKDVNILFMKFNRKGRYVAVQANIDWVKNTSHVVYNSPASGSWLIFEFSNFFKSNTGTLETYSTQGTSLSTQ